jgi:hypothetical protein
LSLVWSDEFDVAGLPDPAKWSYDIERNAAGWFNNELQYYGNAREGVCGFDERDTSRNGDVGIDGTEDEKLTDGLRADVHHDRARQSMCWRRAVRAEGSRGRAHENPVASCAHALADDCPLPDVSAGPGVHGRVFRIQGDVARRIDVTNLQSGRPGQIDSHV